MKSTFLLIISLLTVSPFVSAQKLLQAVEAKNYEQVELYLKKGEKVNKPTKEGHFPLWNAVWNHDCGVFYPASP